jgi:hypothetical protein
MADAFTKARATMVGALNFLKNVTIGGVDVSQWYVEKRKLISTAYFPLSTLTLSAGTSIPLFSGKAGSQNPGIPGISLTAADTNWPSQNNALGSTEMFVGTALGFQLFVATVTTGAFQSAINDPNAAMMLASSIEYTFEEANLTLNRPGFLLDYQAPSIFTSGIAGLGGTATTAPATAAASAASAGAFNGAPGQSLQCLDIPILWKPNVVNDHKLTVQRNITLPDSFLAASQATTGDVIGVRCVMDAYYLRSQAG